MRPKLSDPDASTRVLRLTLNRKWFEMVSSGVKKEEYRTPSAWINSRVNSKKRYDVVEFRNGYRSDSPTVAVEYLGFRYRPGRAMWGAEQGLNYVVILLGRIIPAPNH